MPTTFSTPRLITAWISALMLALVIAALSGCQNPPPPLNGTWRVAQEVGASPISALSEREIKAMLGKSMQVTDQQVEFGKLKCVHPQIQVSRMTPQQFFDDHRIEPVQDWTESTRTLEISCEQGESLSPLLIRDQQFVFVQDGVLFEARKVE